VESAYLSLTRGDGGQNLIGNELGEGLGIIRTMEMLAARRVDNGRQFFTRAFDFGFSKNAEETLEHWPRDSVLGDVVRIVRTFRPHVIVAFWTGTPTDGHGHHQVAGILAREAFQLSADTARFPVLSHGAPWTVQKFYRSARQDTSQATLRMNVGEFNQLLGRSYAEIAGESRSMHRSQGVGALQPKGVVWTMLRRELSRVNEATPASSEQSIFDGIDTTWNRLVPTNVGARAAIDSAARAIAEAKALYRANDPMPIVQPIARALHQLRAARDVGARRPLAFTVARTLPPVSVSASGASAFLAPNDAQRDADLWDALSLTIARLEKTLVLASGVAVAADAPSVTLPVRQATKTNVADSMPVQITVYNRSRAPISVVDMVVPRVGVGVRNAQSRAAGASAATRVGAAIAPDSQLTVTRIAIAAEPTQSWWRVAGRQGALFVAPIAPVDEVEQQLRTQVMALARLEIAGVPVDVIVPVVHRSLDAVKGEQEVPVMAVPGITIGLDNVVEYMRADVRVERELRVHVLSAYSSDAKVQVALQLPAGLVADSIERTRTLTPASPMTTIVFRLRGTVAPGRHQLGAIARHEATASTSGYYTINYEHIPPQNMYAPSGMWLASVNAAVPVGARVGYVPGVSDHGIAALRQLDIPVERLDPATLSTTNLSRYTAIVVGPRAYDAQPELPANNKYLLAYANRGGTLVVQYGQYEMMNPGIMPFAIELSRPASRVTLESAPVKMLSTTSPLLTRPNRIGEDDWAAWVQERAVYMPTNADVRYMPLLAMNDPDEPENRGGLLVANVGRGRYVYVTLSLFRQLPAGVPGAARILLNLIAPRATAAPQNPAR
jgi:LmbE family N-acetylglucosaminyl deacetylase